MESHFEGIAIVVDKILAEFPIPKILRSVPGTLHKILGIGIFIYFSCDSISEIPPLVLTRIGNPYFGDTPDWSQLVPIGFPISLCPEIGNPIFVRLLIGIQFW